MQLSPHSPDPFRPPAAEQPKLENCDTAANLRAWLSGELNGIQPDDQHASWAALHLAVHGTSFRRALSILRDGAIYSHRSLAEKHPDVAADRINNATDQLDIEFGLDRYVFLSVGRVHPFDVQEVYFCFPNPVIERDNALVALREIVHFGAIVSPEAAAVHKRLHGMNDDGIRQRNRDAARLFFENVFSGEDFIAGVFPRFLQKNFPQVVHYTSSLAYPGTRLSVANLGDGTAVAKNAWEGPQLTVPGSLEVRDLKPAVLLTALETSKRRALINAGCPEDRIFSMAEVVPLYGGSLPLGAYGDQAFRYAYVNLALRDLALIGRLNRTGESFADSMNGFKQRLTA